MNEGGKLLELDHLRVHFETDEGLLRAVDGVSLSIGRGRTLGLVGESGAGKSVTAMTILGLTAAPHVRISGRVLFSGRDLTAIGPEEIRAVRGKEIAMIFQDPLTSLHPLYRIGRQIVEAIQAHEGPGDRVARRRAVELLELVGVPDAARRFDEYPHELSGGMRQRAMIAMALANEPKLLIADEPTTALDVTIQAQVLELLGRLQSELGMAMILISHDLGVVAQVADDVAVIYAGRVVERGSADQIFHDPQHPYTWGLLGSMTRADRPLTRRLSQIKGQPPSLIAPPRGCHFRPRCPHELDRCSQVPGLEARSGEARHLDRCWLSPERKRELRALADDEIGLEPTA